MLSLISGPRAEMVRLRNTSARSTRTLGPILKNLVGLAYLDGESDGARSYAATAWVVKGKVP